jgi:hypothetical protein
MIRPFYGNIEKGKLILEAPHAYLVYLASLEGKRIELILKKRKSQRSLAQNSYYWGVVIEILSNHTGYESEEMHEALKVKFLSEGTDEKTGLIKVKSTAKMNTDEFIKYTDKIIRWAAQDLGVFIPDPNQVEAA